MPYVYWQHEDAWIGYLQEFPDYWTQGESKDELEENLKDLWQDLTSGAIPDRGLLLLSIGRGRSGT